MPVYAYRCPKCRKAFSVTEHITEHGGKSVYCPLCRTTTVERRMDAFYAKTSRKSWA